jgi:hypothetical protein
MRPRPCSIGSANWSTNCGKKYRQRPKIPRANLKTISLMVK